MSEVDKGEVQSICWKTIFIAIALLLIGAAVGHVATMKYCWMMRQCGGGYGMKTCWDKGRMGPACCAGHKFGDRKGVCGTKGERISYKENFGKCTPGCMCPKCSKKMSCSAEPNKVSCPTMEKKAGECKKK